MGQNTISSAVTFRLMDPVPKAPIIMSKIYAVQWVNSLMVDASSTLFPFRFEWIFLPG